MRFDLFNDTAVRGHFGCVAVMSTLVGELAACGSTFSWFWPVAAPWQPHARWLDRQDVDAIIVNGEGTIHNPAKRQRVRDLHALPDYARKRGVPIHMINASVAKLDAPAIEALRRFDTIHVRENESRAYLAAHGIEVVMVPDLSLGVAPPARASAREGIIVTDSVLRDTASALRAFAEHAGAHYELMQPALRFSRMEKLRRRVIAHLRVPATRQWHPRSDPSAFMERLSQAGIALTGRFHTFLLSLSTDTPVLAMPSTSARSRR